jgi:hypothetical protein
MVGRDVACSDVRILAYLMLEHLLRFLLKHIVHGTVIQRWFIFSIFLNV